MAVDPRSDRPLFKQIADDLRRSIRSGELAPGDQLPSEADLIERYGVARMTVRNAFAVLAAEGLTLAERGRGVFVRVPPPVVRLGTERFSRALRENGDGAFAAEAKNLGLTPTQEILDVGEVPVPAHVAERLGLAEGDPVAVRRRRMSADDVPMQLATSYLPVALARKAGLLRADSGPGGSYARLEEAGHRLARFREELVGRAPTEDEVHQLRLVPGVPVVQLTRVAYDERGDVVEVFESVAAGDRHVFVYEFTAPE